MPIYWTFKTLLDTGRYAFRYAVHREEICVEGTGVWKFIKFGSCNEEHVSKVVGDGCGCTTSSSRDEEHMDKN